MTRLEKEGMAQKQHVDIIHSRITRDKAMYCGPEYRKVVKTRSTATLLVQVGGHGLPGCFTVMQSVAPDDGERCTDNGWCGPPFLQPRASVGPAQACSVVVRRCRSRRSGLCGFRVWGPRIF